MAGAASCSFNNEPSLRASCFSTSAAALSGNDASNSASSLPASCPSIQAVNFSSNVFINVPQQSLQFFAGVEKPGHDRADRAVERFCDLVILHVFNFLHQNDGAMFRR